MGRIMDSESKKEKEEPESCCRPGGGCTGGDGAGVSEEIVLDMEGRPAGIESGLKYDFQVFEKVLRGQLDMLKMDCAEAFNASELMGDDEYSSGDTYFIGAGEEPACELERLALEIFKFHTKNAKGIDIEKSGAEWWTQVIEDSDDIGLHFDRDYILEATEGINIHPHIATVTYLEDRGAPTIALDLKPPSVKGAESGGAGTAKTGIACFPKSGNHLSFDGRFLHCAPAELSRTRQEPADSDEEKEDGNDRKRKSEERITLLVNIWLNYVPMHAARMEEEKRGLLSSTLGSTEIHLTDEAIMKTAESAECTMEDKEVTMTFIEASRNMELKMHVKDAQFQPSVDIGGAIKLSFKENACELTAGEFVEDDEDQEDDEEEGNYNEDDSGRDGEGAGEEDDEEFGEEDDEEDDNGEDAGGD